MIFLKWDKTVYPLILNINSGGKNFIRKNDLTSGIFDCFCQNIIPRVARYDILTKTVSNPLGKVIFADKIFTTLVNIQNQWVNS